MFADSGKGVMLLGMSDPSRIRKDVGELTLEDLAIASVWEFGLDEECNEDQTECTVRPLMQKRNVDPARSSYAVVCDFATRGDGSGKSVSYVGMVFPDGVFKGPQSGDPCILVDRPVGQIVEHPLLHGYNAVLSAESPRLNFGVPHRNHAKPGDVRASMDLCYQVLGLSPDRLFPLTCRPRVPIKGWPKEYEIPGFLRPESFSDGTFSVEH